MSETSAPPARWLQRAIEAAWPGGRAASIAPLKGDASTRRFWRVWLDSGRKPAPATAVVVDLGPDDVPPYARALSLYPEPLPEPPYLNVQRFLKSIEVPVPEVYYSRRKERLLLVEDVGDRSLFQSALSDPARAPALYCAAVEELLRIHVDGTIRRDPRCYAFRIQYNGRLFGWELEQFAEFGLAAVAPDANREAVLPDLAELAARMDCIPRVFSHRDYHGGNLFVDQGAGREIRLRVLDFQDALLAAPAHDLALLMTTRDTARVVTPALENRLLDFYLGGLSRRGVRADDRAQFVESYRLCVLQHALKMIGRFTLLERAGKPGYAVYVPHAVAQARRMLRQGDDFPSLRQMLGVG